MNRKVKIKNAFTLAESGLSPLLCGDEGVAEGYSCVETKGLKWALKSGLCPPLFFFTTFNFEAIDYQVGVFYSTQAYNKLLKQIKEMKQEILILKKINRG